MWLHVGHSALTQLSVARQFTQVVQQTQVFPERIRADRGTETGMLADAQNNLYRHWLYEHGLITEMSDYDRFPLRDCFIFGPSTKNVKIEGWWNQLQRRQLSPWRVWMSNNAKHNTRLERVSANVKTGVFSVA